MTLSELFTSIDKSEKDEYLNIHYYNGTRKINHYGYWYPTIIINLYDDMYIKITLSYWSDDYYTKHKNDDNVFSNLFYTAYVIYRDSDDEDNTLFYANFNSHDTLKTVMGFLKEKFSAMTDNCYKSIDFSEKVS